MKRWADAEIVKEELKKEGRTRAWLVEYCGVGGSTMDRYLAGYQVPPLPVLKLMEQALPRLAGKLLEPAEAKKATA